MFVILRITTHKSIEQPTSYLSHKNFIIMTLQDFMTLLAANPQKEVFFEYEAGKTVPIQYHVTEVKNISIESMDCGGNPHSDKQVWVQLWATDEEQKDQALSGQKIASIIQKVHEELPLFQDKTVYFEYGNQETRTSVYQVQKVEDEEKKLTVKLFAEPTQCKPRSECGPNCC